jgi:hypothetical protein
MAKKNKRYVSGRSTAGTTAMPTRSEFNPDYSHVKRDLKRIGTLAASIFAVLIVLSFFLR